MKCAQAQPHVYKPVLDRARHQEERDVSGGLDDLAKMSDQILIFIVGFRRYESNEKQPDNIWLFFVEKSGVDAVIPADFKDARVQIEYELLFGKASIQ